MGFGMFLSGDCDTKCRWKMSHLHRTNMVKWQDGRRTDIKPTCGTKNDWKREQAAARPKKHEKIGIA